MITLGAGKVRADVTIIASRLTGGLNIEGVSGGKEVTIDGTGALTASSLSSGSQSGVLGAGTTPTALKKPTGASDWTVDDLKGSFVQFLSGTSTGTIAPVKSNTANAISIHSASGVASGDSFAIVTPGTDLGVVTVSGCTASIKFKCVKIERLITDSNSKVSALSCHFDTPHVDGSLLSQWDRHLDLTDCMANSVASLKVVVAPRVTLKNLVLETATVVTDTCLSVIGEAYANLATSTPISFIDCLKVECGIDSNNNSGGADGVLIDGSSFAPAGVGIMGSGNTGYGVRVDGVSARADLTAGVITGTAGDVIVGTSSSTWANLAAVGGIFDSGAYAGVGQGMAVAGPMQVIAPSAFTTQGNYNQSGRLLGYGYFHFDANGADLNLTAFPGGGQPGATQLGVGGVSVVASCVTNGDSVKLQSGHAGLGVTKFFLNKGASTCHVFPSVGQFMDGFVNGASPVPAGTSKTFVAVDATHWVSA